MLRSGQIRVLHCLLAFFVALIGGATITSASAEQRRVALVIGNSAYEHLGTLNNPAGDAEAIAQSLSAVGFTVFLTTDLDQIAFVKAIEFFQTRAANADTSLLYFAGHGATYNGQNYLFPTDFGKGGLYELREAISLDAYLDQISSGLRNNLVFIDACRENPLRQHGLPGSSQVHLNAKREDSTDSPRIGTLVSFATTPGQVAFDGSGRHSPYTGALLDHLATPKTDIEKVLKAVRRDVVVNTRGVQVPWMASSLLGDVYLGATAENALAPSSSTAPSTPIRTLGAALAETGFDQKPILSHFQVGLSVSETTPQDQHNNRVDHTAQIKSLLCSVMEPPLPEGC